MLTDAVLFEAMLRAAAAGLFLATAIVIGRSFKSPGRASGALCYASKASHVLAQFPPAVAPLGGMYLLLDMPSIVGASLAWIFATEFFEESQRFDKRKLIPLGVVVVNAIIAKMVEPEIARMFWLFHNFITVALMSHVFIVVFRSWSGDLVERRRLIVAPLFLFSCVYSIGVAFVQTIETFSLSAREPSIFAAAILLGSSLLGVFVFGQAGPSLFRQEKTVSPSATVKVPTATLTPAERAIHSDLERIMRTERLYRIQNLRISALAQQLRVPEHRLRHLLNQGLGFRNFNAYIGQWRIDEAREALADPEQVAVPISTIGIDSGFQSLAPFNRAFKRETGLTPTEFRARAMRAAGLGAEVNAGDVKSDPVGLTPSRI